MKERSIAEIDVGEVLQNTACEFAAGYTEAELAAAASPHLFALLLERFDTLNGRMSDIKSGLDGIDDKLAAIEYSTRKGPQ
jgi:hypothetical protein